MVTRSGTETHCCNEWYTDAEREVLVGQEQTNCGARERQREARESKISFNDFLPII